ncbi:MAG: DUF3857 domain-containing protein, partial [Sphingobacteriales bacterium]
VIRINEVKVEVISPSEIIVRKRLVATIMNEQGDDLASYFEHFSKLQKIEDIYGRIYDKSGKVIEKIKKSEFHTRAATLSAGSYDDLKMMGYTVSYKSYPYTVEFCAEIVQNHSYYLPELLVRPDRSLSVEKSSISINAPSGMEVNAMTRNGQFRYIENALGDRKEKTWEIGGVRAEKEEFLEVQEYDGSPLVLLTLSQFQLGTREGSMKDWKSFGLFIYHLNNGRDKLDGATRKKVSELTVGLPGKFAKIEKLYKYLQESTRYVSIQYGIGGWQTLDASFVSANQYGDCKALSNYMQAMLKEAGIPSFTVLVSSGSTEFRKMPLDFPSNEFNHQILCVPMEKDTVWLECTSNIHPAGFTGASTADRDALMITPEGGVVVHTPRYDYETNARHSSVIATPDKDGSLNCIMHSELSGILAERLLSINSLNSKQREHYLNNRLAFAGYKVDEYVLEENHIPMLARMMEMMRFTVSNIASPASSYFMVNLNLLPVTLPFEPQIGERLRPFTLTTGFGLSDTLSLVIPDGYDLDTAPKEVNLKTEFGEFHLAYTWNNKMVSAARKFIQHSGVFAAEKYEAYERWVDSIQDQNYYRVVLKAK